MSAIDMDHYWPMAEGPGAGADFARWRRMASIWSKDGVARGVGESFQFHGWVSPGISSIGTGAAWVNCAYGESGLDPYRHHHMLTPGDDGMIFVVMDPFNQRMYLDFGPGIHGDNMDAYNNPLSFWHLPLWELNGNGNFEGLIDRRRYVPEDPPPPPITVIPSWVPGRIVHNVQNESWVGGDGGNPLVMYLGWRDDYVAPRHWRFNIFSRGDNWNATSTNGWGYTGSLFVRVGDVTNDRRYRVKMGGPATGSTQAGVVRFEAVTATFVVPNCWGNLIVAFEQVIEASQAGGAWSYPAGSLSIEAEEIGSDESR